MVLTSICLVHRWTVTGGELLTECGTLDSGSALVFRHAGVRELTTPDMDITVANEVQFYLMIGMVNISIKCSDN